MKIHTYRETHHLPMELKVKEAFQNYVLPNDRKSQATQRLGFKVSNVLNNVNHAYRPIIQALNVYTKDMFKQSHIYDVWFLEALEDFQKDYPHYAEQYSTFFKLLNRTVNNHSYTPLYCASPLESIIDPLESKSDSSKSNSDFLKRNSNSVTTTRSLHSTTPPLCFQIMFIFPDDDRDLRGNYKKHMNNLTVIQEANLRAQSYVDKYCKVNQVTKKSLKVVFKPPFVSGKPVEFICNVSLEEFPEEDTGSRMYAQPA